MPTSSEGSRHLQQRRQQQQHQTEPSITPTIIDSLGSSKKSRLLKRANLKPKLEPKPTSSFKSTQLLKRNNNPNSKRSEGKYQASVIKHISPPSSLTSTSNVLQSMSDHRQLEVSNEQQALHKSTVNLAGQLVRTGNKSISTNNAKTTTSNKHSLDAELILGAADNEAYLGSRPSLVTITATNKGSTFNTPFLVNSSSSSAASQSNMPLSNPASSNSSTSQLHSLAYGESNHNNIVTNNRVLRNNKNNIILNNNNQRSAAPFSIKQQVNLKYIKTIIILLLAVDLLITVFVHQFSSQDYLSIWFTSFKLRFSLLNLILSAIWSIILIAAILFDIYFILVISFIVDIISFFLLLGFSFIHFYRRIDYNTVNLTSLLLLLFSIIVLHVYLIVLSTLTLYLMQAVRRRQKCPSNS